MGAATSKPGAHGREKKTQKVKGGKGRAHGGREDEEEREERTLLFMTTEEVMQPLAWGVSAASHRCQLSRFVCACAHRYLTH